MYKGWEQDAARAAVKWHVTHRFENGNTDRGGMAAAFTENWMTRQVCAEAGTGSRYDVVATVLGLGNLLVGGPVLVSVIHPWGASYAMQREGELHMSYVAEKFCGGREYANQLNGGDLAALTKTIGYVLGRPTPDVDDLAALSVTQGRTDV